MLINFLGLVFCMTIFSDAKPLEPSTTTNLNNQLLNYLLKYGYLTDKTKTMSKFVYKNGTLVQVNITTTPTYDNDEITFALKDMQSFMSIPQTGQIDVETIKVLNQPRCGVKDRVPKNSKDLYFKVRLTPKGKRKRRDALKYFYQKTHLQGITYKWIIDPYAYPTQPDIWKLSVELAQFGVNYWAAVSNLMLINTKSWPESDIALSFYTGRHGHGYPFDGPGGHLAHASSTIMDIHFDDEEKWLYHKVDSTDFRKTGKMPDFIQTVIHEMGHVLGLRHSSSKKAVMYPSVTTGPVGSRYGLDQEDIDRIQKIYGRCWPERIDTVFSNYKGDQKTYLVVGPFIYMFNDAKLQVEQSFPRAAYNFFNSGFNLFDTIFYNTDGKMYFMWNGWYYHDSTGSSKSWNHVGTSPNTGVVGWPGLREDTIDAAFMHTDGKLYLLRKDLVYRWDPNAASPVLPHYPKGRVEAGWPKKISDVFPGLPNDIDSAFRWLYDGGVYFFKGKYFYIWDDKQKKAVGLYSTDQWKNICDVVSCGGTTPCRSWALNKSNCKFCNSN